MTRNMIWTACDALLAVFYIMQQAGHLALFLIFFGQKRKKHVGNQPDVPYNAVFKPTLLGRKSKSYKSVYLPQFSVRWNLLHFLKIAGCLSSKIDDPIAGARQLAGRCLASVWAQFGRYRYKMLSINPDLKFWVCLCSILTAVGAVFALFYKYR